MPRRNPRDVRSLLDLEAAVDHDEEEEEEEGASELDGFIDDAGNNADLLEQQVPHLLVWARRWFGKDFGRREKQGGSNEEEEEEEEEEGEEEQQPGVALGGEEDLLHDGARFPAETPSRTRDEAFESLISDFPLQMSLQSILKDGDYPLWRVPCRGVEQEAVFCLLKLASSPHYELRSAFTRGSVRGYVYLEATMNPSLVSLLKRIPGIRRESGSLRYDGIPQEDWEALLMMTDSKATPVVGEWVLISHGKYKGDIAYVSSFEDWQGVSVLLIPRIAYGDECPQTSKRKRAPCRPLPRLFNPCLVPNDSHIQPIQLKDEVYRYGSLRMENGLVRQSFDLHSISQGVFCMPTEVLGTFQQSKHRELLNAQYPCPAEFKFEEQELVLVLPANVTGKITTLRQCEAEVALLNGEGDVNVSWTNMRKYVVLGDYVDIVSGTHQGHQGFVTTIYGDIITVSELETVRYHTTTKTVKELEIHVNWVKVITPPQTCLVEDLDVPFSRAAPEIDEVTKVFRTPWIHRYVIVTKPKHPMKGSHAKVIDAIRPENSSSKPHLVVQYERISPTGPKRERLSYDDVVDAVSSKKLYANLSPEHPFFFNSSEPQADSSMQPHFELQASNVGSTPAWSPSSTGAPLSPAWDPSAMTPFILPCLTPWNISSTSRSETSTASTSTSPQNASATAPTTARPPPAHPLLDPRLVGKMLRVSVSGGSHPKKETPVSVVLGQTDEVTIRQSWRNESFGLMPEWVTPKHPHPTRDNGLLVVIRGDHCGKYVRRIHHYYANNDRNQPIMQLAVLERADGAERLTEERVELPPEDLCQGFETEKEKSLNAKLMTSLRDQARNTQPS